MESVRAFFQAMSQGEFQAVTSTLTLTEVLIHPLRAGNMELAGQYRDILFAQENLITLPVSPTIAESAAQLRATHNLRTPDAIQLATAMQGGATACVEPVSFWTKSRARAVQALSIRHR